ncbi:hypothetical protein SEUCBS140593_006324 [Sporothrix eucalyptigena]|uniref:Uncharacterized protein n=1 Tax=Sporothrix eucalyptigena TaxID=1812306 RepID=A0ABP0C4W2_9PEZI
MAPTKGKKRAYSNVPVDDSEIENIGQDDCGSPQVPSLRPAQTKKSRGNDWSSWQDGVRTQEANRVKQYVGMFQKDIVAAAREKAMAALSRGEEAKVKRDKKNLEGIREAYDAASTGACMGIADHQLYKAGREVLELFHATIARYEQANTALEQALKGDAGDKTVDDVQASWNKDREEAQKLLRYGRVYGDSLVHEIIVPKTVPGGPVGGEGQGKTKDSKLDAMPESELNKTGRTALDMFPKSRATVARGQTWGEAAKSQVQALKGLLKTLPGMGGNQHGEPTTAKSVTFNC